MDSSEVRDIIQLPIFQCKTCYRRLQAPIFQVGMLGNICGKCYERSAYINVTRNSDIEDFLRKLYVPCNFAKCGCTFEGPYIKTCRHETNECRFRKRMCPFAYTNQQCEYEYQESKDITDHIQKNHTDNVLETHLVGCSVKHPTESNPNNFYLIQVRNTFILLRTMLNTQHICYAFYYFDEFKPEDVHISFLNFDSQHESFKLMHESMIDHAFPLESAFIVLLLTLEHLGLLEDIIIRFRRANVEPIDNMKISKIKKRWVKCQKCYKIVENIKICLNCGANNCVSCANWACCNSVNYSGPIYLEKIKASNKILCGNIGCNKMIRGDLYDVHKKWQCSKIKLKCIYEKCTFEDFHLAYLQHILTVHFCKVNSIVLLPHNKWSTAYFSNGDDVFYHMYFLKENNKFEMIAIKLTEPYWTSNFIYIITIKGKSDHDAATIQGDYTTEGYTKTVQFGDYITGEITVTTSIKRI